ncbi:MAG: carboxypeptidase M32 [Candidatus Sumerlaeota bacterium]|nr:carboxypeptidase M32 [Candidatus Sumerlaeota bacterium]
MPPTEYEQLMARTREAADLAGAESLLSWDEETHMPPKGLAMRARQLATLSGLIHAKRTDKAVGRLLTALRRKTLQARLSPLEQAVARETRYDYDRAAKLPESLVRELAETTALAVEAWRQARAESRLRHFAPHLKKIVDLQRRKAEAYGYEDSPYDALLEDYERGMTAARLRPIFATLRERLSRMVRQIAEAPDGSARDLLERHYDFQKQWDFGLRVLADMGFDLDAGRQDRSAHPFTSGTHPLDVRLTTRINENDFAAGLFSTMHEGGHGLYEQGFHPDHWDTVLAAAPSLGAHESQSRLWENLVGRSRAFWRHYFPAARETFPDALGGATAEDFYRAVNVVRPSLIRVEADETTYSLHIILRFEIEAGLIEGSIEVDDLPALWNARMVELLGLEPPDDARGVLQDIHWAHGLIGYFPTYALGNLYAAQIFRRLSEELSDVETLLELGQLLPIRDWLNLNIHQVGRTKTTERMVADVCGEGLSAEPFLQALARKFGDIYEVELD